MTLATVIREVYRSSERHDLRDALKTLLPADGQDWHPSGLYCFWDPATHEVLYLGLASDIQRRFAQHNALSGSSAKGNKREQIDSWFKTNDTLGYSIIVQSAAVVLLEQMGMDTFSDIIATGEGQLIEAHVQKFGQRPAWNKIGGSTYGATWAGVRSPGYFGLLTGRSDSLLVARRTIRQLAAEPESVQHEMTLHSGRMHALHNFGMTDGVDDSRIMEKLSELAQSPYLVSELPSHINLVASGYLMLDAPHPERMADEVDQ
ncbi:hypothetical protein ABZ896_17270 [Streptomyces sp. NPDC047072]|uniref:hypothetical protein n=1 Tax=Streptomyces sp. NPDC047072 TaxID=3154809 RepID=UPI0033E6AD24